MVTTIERQMRLKHFVLLAPVLAACSATPSVPYWQDPHWQQALLDTVHKNVLYPTPISADTPPTGEGTAAFDVLGGKLENIQLIKSTGYERLDQAIVQGLGKTIPPAMNGKDSAAGHRFELTLQMEPGIDQFRGILYDAVTEATKLPEEVFTDHPEFIFVNATYLNGSFTNVEIQLPGASTVLKRVFTDKFNSARLPLPSSNLKDKTIDVSMNFCVTPREEICFHDDRDHWVNVNGTLTRFRAPQSWVNAHGLTYIITPDGPLK
jgi:hypothetical protein